MSDFILRQASINDVSFLIKTILEAEKSGTNILSYSTIFNISEQDAIMYIEKILLEEIEGCELSISSFSIVEYEQKIVAASSSWIEAFDGISSSVIKGNLLNYILPKICIQKAAEINSIIREIHFEKNPNTFQLGLVYVSEEFRGMNLVKKLIEEQIKILLKLNANIFEMYVQVYDINIPAIKAYEKIGFKKIQTKVASDKQILNYLPSDTKFLMKLDIESLTK